MKLTAAPTPSATWCRLRCDLLDQDLWAVVAARALTSRDRVEAFVVRLALHASSSGGSLDGFSVAALAARWRCSLAELGRIYAELERPEIAVIATPATSQRETIRKVRELVPVSGEPCKRDCR